MRPPGKQRLAQRYNVRTTPVVLRMRRRGRGPQARLHPVTAALVEVSVMGAALIAPEKWELTPGNRSEMTWEDFTGVIVVRRVAPYPRKDGLYLYGIEYCDGRSLLGPALYDELVVAAGIAQPPMPSPAPAPDPEAEASAALVAAIEAADARVAAEDAAAAAAPGPRSSLPPLAWQREG